MLVRERDGLNQIAVLEDGVLVEHYVARHTQTSMVGNVYLGRVQNVLPSMEAAFVDIGKGRNAVLYAGEVNWAAAGMSGQPRKIEQALKSGDHVLVQVTKDPIGHKGARLTSQITLAGRHLVFVPSGSMTGISRKLPEGERNRLKKILKEIVPSGSGVIVRTAAEGATEQQLKDDVDRLTKIWADIEKKSGSGAKAPVLLKGEPELAVRVVRDVFNEDFRSLTVQGDTAWTTINGYVTDLAPDLADRVEHWTEPGDLFAAHRVDEQLAKGMDRKVWLPSGGSLVIDRTEAMTVVDVNTGKFTGSGGTLEETVTKNNLEAAEEIVRQLRLRDIGGIIVIDFIDMVLPQNRDLVVRRLLECLGRDRTRHQVAEVTSLGLVQMTRKRVGQGLVEAFSTPCEHCHGRGFIVHDHPIERSDAAEAQIADSSEQSSGRGKRRGGRGRSGGSNGSGSNGSGNGSKGSGSAQQAEQTDSAPKAEPDREAVRATLAQIASAAQAAHGRSDDDQATEAGSPTAAAGSANQDAAGGVGETAASSDAADSSAATDAPAAEAASDIEAKPATTRGSGRKRSGSRRATSSGSARAVADESASETPADGAAEAETTADPEPKTEAAPTDDSKPTADSASQAEAETTTASDAPAEPESATEEAAPKRKPAQRRASTRSTSSRSTAKSAGAADAAGDEASQTGEASSNGDAATASTDSETGAAEAATGEATTEAPAKPARAPRKRATSSRTTKAAAKSKAEPADGEATTGSTDTGSSDTTSAATGATTEAPAGDQPAGSTDASSEGGESKPATRPRRSRRATAPAATAVGE
jgi:ribonuclease E